jgi:hypothetical protein
VSAAVLSHILTTSTDDGRIRENYEISPLPDDAMEEIRHKITTNIRFNSVVESGVPGFIPRSGECNDTIDK